MGNGKVDLVAEHPGAEIIEIELDWDEPRDPLRSRNDDAGRGDRIRDWRGTKHERTQRRFDARWLIVGVALVFAVWILSSGETADDAASPPVDRAGDAGPVVDPGTPDPSLDLAAAIAGLTDEDLVTAWLEVQVDPDEVDKYALLRPVDRVPGEYRFAYVGADGNPIVIDSGTGELRSILTEVPADEDTGEVLLRAADGTLGFDPAAPDEAIRFATGLQVVRRQSGELLALDPTGRDVSYGAFSPGQALDLAVLPGSAEVDIVPDVGAFVTAQSGGTLEITPAGLLRITPHEIVATNGTRWLEFRRVANGANQMVVTTAEGADGDEWVLDNDLLDFGRGPAISPDGEWIFLPNGREGDAFPAMYEIETGRIYDFEQRVAGLDAIWAPASEFVAMLDPGRDCIYLFFTGGNNGCISLGRLQIPALSTSGLVVFAPPAASTTPSDPPSSATSE